MRYSLALALVTASAILGNSAAAQDAASEASLQPGISSSTQPLVVRFRLEALERASITAQRDGYISELPIRLGANVDAKQLLAQFDERRTKAQVQVTENELRELKVAHKAAKRELELLQQADKKLKAAYPGGGVTETELLRLQATLEQSEALAAAKEAELEIAKLELSVSKINAPFVGTIAHISRYRGSWIKAGEPIAELARMDKLIAALSVRQEQIAPYRITGATADVSIADLNNMPGDAPKFQGRVVRVTPKVDSDGVYLAFLEIENKKGKDLAGNQQWLLRPGMAGQATISLADSAPADELAANKTK